ncbi:MAG: aminotransferase class I/II-fold pyridoxal phosphate-dependent enzyme [bacterium]|nr:aminotransferase class I/II-fold pyridoxal phosphate-dependent enzyme [bacterium]
MSRADDICPRIDDTPKTATQPAAAAIYPATVWACDSPEQADQLLAGEQAGYVYQRNGHPNADLFTDKAKQLHGADHALATSTGMAALSVAMLSQLKAGSQLVISDQLYGQSSQLLAVEAERLGVHCRTANLYDLKSAEAAISPGADLVVVETIANPLLRVADIRALSKLTHTAGGKLLVDNTFATPILCQPLSLGADLVMESVSKLMNGHSDAMLGLLCGSGEAWNRVERVAVVWGFTSSPFDCYLASRGLVTLPLRCERANHNARAIAQHLSDSAKVAKVIYPGLANHPDHELANQQFKGQFGAMISFNLPDREAVDRFIANCQPIRFCPSLGEAPTTVSHPATTSHRSLSKKAREQLGVCDGTVRVSIGIESADGIREAIDRGLAAT